MEKLDGDGLSLLDPTSTKSSVFLCSQAASDHTPDRGPRYPFRRTTSYSIPLLLFLSHIPVPFLVFGNSTCRTIAFLGTVILNAAINVFGNFAFLGIMTIVECIFLLGMNWCLDTSLHYLEEGVWASLLRFNYKYSSAETGPYPGVFSFVGWTIFFLYFSISMIALYQ